MKKILKLLLCAAVLSVMVFGTAASAACARPMEYFTITDYTVNAVVSESNVYDITETIQVRFSQPRHGIYRDIPFSGKMYITDDSGTKISKSYRASISNISVQGYEYEVSTESGYKQIKIGNKDEFVQGDQTYVISYRMNFGNDGIPEFDMLNYNIIGTQWGTTIDHVNFSITLPKEFDASKLGFNVGSEGTSGYNPETLKFNVSGNTISGELTQQLGTYQALTVTMKLPQGYYKVSDLRIPDWILMGVMGLLTILSIVLFIKYGRDEKPVQTVEFGPPDGLTSAEIGYINDGVVDTRDIVSLILYWADKGYLGIKEEDKEFTLMKARDMGDEAKPFEQHMFNKLFHDGPTVTTGDLKYTFYKTINSTKSMVENSFEAKARRVFTKASSSLKPLMSFFAALPVMMTLFLTFWRNDEGFVSAAVFTGIAGVLILLPVFFLIGTLRKWRAYKPAARAALLILEIVLIVGTLAAFIGISYGKAYEPMLPFFAALMTIIISLVAVFIVKRTPQGVEWAGKISGFRDFIERAEKDKLLMMVEQNPNYFYSVLPYAYVLNVTDKWAKNFESIALEPPQWYYGYNNNTFNSLLFMHSLNTSMNSIQSSMASTPSSSGSGGGGGGFSGGGFSGGGGGGGGGGSW